MKDIINMITRLPVIIILLLAAVSCGDDTKTPQSTPVIETLAIENAGNITMPDTIYFSASVADALRPLSTLEVQVFAGEDVLYTRSIRTKGNAVTLQREAIPLDFLPNIGTGDQLRISFTLINVDGAEARQQKTVTVQRPELPPVLYFTSADGTVMELRAEAENPFTYVSDEGDYLSILSGKLATDANHATARFIWNGSATSNVAAIGERFGTDIAISYPSWIVTRIVFNALTFTFTVDGTEVPLQVKGIPFGGSDGYMYAEIPFTEGEEFTITGIDNPELQYNRDFFSYDAETGLYTFLRAAGTWQIYYSPIYKYLWVMRMSDVAPACYWIVGHGFTSAPAWHADFGYGGWDTADPARIACVVSIGGGQYQATLHISDAHEWGNFEFEIYSDREWGKDSGIELSSDAVLTGDTQGFTVSGSKGLTTANGFTPGNYRLTFDLSSGPAAATLHIEKLID